MVPQNKQPSQHQIIMTLCWRCKQSVYLLEIDKVFVVRYYFLKTMS